MTDYPAPKQAFDKVVSLVLLVLLVPVFAVVLGAIAIDMLFRRADRGPLLYRELRISRGRSFELLKFRTLKGSVLRGMDADSHARLHEAVDANLTWAGRRLLKPWYLDELPQLWNVLRGDMSIVGPRPWPSPMVERQVAEGLRYRNEFIAGWTGPAQVTKGVTEPEGYAALDLEYVQACGASSGVRILARDLVILWQTLVVTAKGEGLRF